MCICLAEWKPHIHLVGCVYVKPLIACYSIVVDTTAAAVATVVVFFLSFIHLLLNNWDFDLPSIVIRFELGFFFSQYF